MSTQVRVGIAGLGRSGWSNHALTLQALPKQFKIAAVTDPDPKRCAEAAGNFGCKTYGDLNSLLADPEVDLAILATPSQLHCDQTLAALAAGKHVVCEKPMAANSAETARMVAAAQKTDKILTVFQNQRYMPSFLKVREVIASGKLGRIIQIRIAIHGFARRWDWQTLKEFSGGELNNTGSHFMDQALLLLGPNDPEISCHLERTLTSGDAEDHCKIILKAKNAPMIDLEITRACAYGQDLWLVMGTSGGLTGNASQLRWKYVDFAKMPPRPVERTPTPDRSYNSETLEWKEETWEQPKDLPSTQTCFYTDLYKTLREHAPLSITPQSVQRQITMMERCRKLCPVI
jgi:scyllo-inositol 2-dehydrogenase (NADP+)